MVLVLSDREARSLQACHAAGKLPTEQPKGRPSAHGGPRETTMTPHERQPRRVITRRDDATSRGNAAISRRDDPSYPPLSARADPIANGAFVSGPNRRTDVPRESDPSYPFAAMGDFGRAGQAVRAGNPDAAEWPSRSSPQSNQSKPSAQMRAGAKHAQGDGGIVAAIPFVGVLAVTLAGVYIAWHQGSAGGGAGGVVGGVALLIAAIARLLLPTRLVGLLATRKRANDVVTLTIFGTSLLVVGLVLPG
jgi:hypothetical protein